MKRKTADVIIFLFLLVMAVIFTAPVFIIVMNSFKGRFFISDTPFKLPDKTSFVGLENYVSGLAKTGFFSSFGYSLLITVLSVAVIVLGTSMTAWYIQRHRNAFTKTLYYAFIFSMIVPFQMVMFTLSTLANRLGLSNPLGIVPIYLGFGAGLSVFLFSGFIKSVPISIEEAAAIDGCSESKTFFSVVFPMLTPIAVTVAILNAMWIWNDYLLPSLVLDRMKYKTIPVAVQSLRGSYGSVDMGAMMAMLVLSILPIIIFYLTSQKQIIKGVAAGAVKG